MVKEIDKLKRWYKQELNRRDEQIKKLKEENLLLLKTIIRNQEKRTQNKRNINSIKKKKT